MCFTSRLCFMIPLSPGKTALMLKNATLMHYRLVSLSDCPTWAAMCHDYGTALATITHAVGSEKLAEGVINLLYTI